MDIVALRNERVIILSQIGMRLKEKKEYWITKLLQIEPFHTACDEVDKTIRALCTYEKELKYLTNRVPIGTYRVMVPFNNPLYSFVLYSCGIALAGNTVIVRPSKHTGSIISSFYEDNKELFSQIGVSLFEGRGKDFISDAKTQTIPGGLLFTGTYDSLCDIQKDINPEQNLIYCGSGKCPAIVFNSCDDLEKAIDLIVETKLYNSGQDCLCFEKIAVQSGIFDNFKSLLIAKLKRMKLGSFGDKEADVFPPNSAIGIEEVNNRYRIICNDAKLIYENKDKDKECFISVFECSITSDSFNMEKFCPIFTIARFDSIDELQPLLLSDYKFGITLFGNTDTKMFKDFPHISSQRSVMSVEGDDAHVRFGGCGKSGFSIVNGEKHVGAILFSEETSIEIKQEKEPNKMSNLKFDTRPFYNGCYNDSFGKNTFETINPATEEVIAVVPESEDEDIDLAVESAQKAFEEWSQMDPIERGQVINLIADAIEENADELVAIDVMDAGRPILDAQEDIEAVVRMYRYYSGVPSKIEGTTIPTGSEKLVFTQREPYGVIAAITAWNYPLFNMTAKVAPIIATGNACVLKPAEETPLVALKVAEIVSGVPGVPAGLLNVINGRGEVTGAKLIAHPGIKKVTFTGSTFTGNEILKNIGNNNVKGVLFELGGKAPVVVCSDANLDGAAKAIAFCAFFNQGQTCTAATRILVEKSVHDELIKKIAEIAERIAVGDPTSEDTAAGPVVSKTQYEKVIGYISRAIDRGEKLYYGGMPKGFGKGYYVIPTIFDEVSKESELFSDEIFGPVITVTTFENDDEAVELANFSKYGLAAGVWTKNIERMNFFASKIKCGIMWCNTLFAEFPGAPAGGFNNSGIGREFGKEAITEYTRIKTVWLAYNDGYSDWV